MISELIASVVGNGTTVWNWGYAPWLPFSNFLPALILGSIFLSLAYYCIFKYSVTRAILWGSVFLTSGLSAVVVVFMLWVKLDLNPSQVFFWWSVNWIMMILGQTYYIYKNKRVMEQIKEMEDREI